MKNSIKTRGIPSNEFRYWLFSPEGDGLTFFLTAEDRDAFAAEEITHYLDEFWGEEVEGFCAGEVTHIAQQTDVERKPADADEIEASAWPEDVDGTCNYKLMPLQACRERSE